MAVGGVSGKLVSTVASLIDRENTGKSFETSLSWRIQSRYFEAFPQL
jgi:hypothetical protein